MKRSGLIGVVLVIFLWASGCATVDHSVVIDTDKLDGYASGQYKDSHYGQMGEWGFWFLGGYNTSDSASGAKPLWFWPWGASKRESDPRNFARSIAIINYSKKLNTIKYDEASGIVEYEFEHKPILKKSGYQPAPSTSSLPSSFGYQPIE